MVSFDENQRADGVTCLDTALARLSNLKWTVLPPSSVATPCLNASVSWPACVGERH